MIDRTASYAKALREVYDRATPQDVQNGRIWYPMARGDVYDVAKRYRVSLKRACFAAAALSNNMAWEQNVALLEHCAFSATVGQDPHGHYPMCLERAMRILRAGDFAALSGPKVVPFAHALVGDTRAAVVDRWVYRAAAESGWPTLKRSRDIAVALRMVAKDIRRSVSETQAIIWVTVQRLSAQVETASKADTPF